MAVLKDTLQVKNSGRCENGSKLSLINLQKAVAFILGCPCLDAFALTIPLPLCLNIHRNRHNATHTFLALSRLNIH